MQFFALGDTIIVLLIPERLDKEGSFFRSTIVYKSNIFLGEIFSERNYGKYIFYKEKETEEILLPRIIQLFQLSHRQKSRLFAASINSRTRTVLNTYSRGNMCVCGKAVVNRWKHLVPVVSAKSRVPGEKRTSLASY